MISGNSNKPILLTGASGYVGGRLLKVLESLNKPLRCIARRPDYLRPKVSDKTEIVKADILNYSDIYPAMQGIETAYYLIHSMGSRGAFEEEDRLAAKNFARAAKAKNVKRIIYLGGLGDSSTKLSSHLKSRQEVGKILKEESGTQVIEFRASIVIGSGSLSFEMIRSLMEKLPVMVTPKWVYVKTQPIGINDLIRYLVDAIDLKYQESRIFEIGGADVTSYGGIMKEYAKQRGLKRTLIPVPILTPYISSLWLGLVTPLYARVGKKMIDSIQNPTVVNDKSAEKYFTFRPSGIKEAIRFALINEDRSYVQTRWSDALSSSGKVKSLAGITFGRRIVDSISQEVKCSPEKAFKPIQQIGGTRGWYFANWLWRLRGFLDILAAGVGLKRGRPDPIELNVGDAVDWWRVEDLQKNKRLLLASEMKLPGRAWLEFEVKPSEKGSIITQTAIYDPIGVKGHLYWYSLYPIHKIIFRGMLKEIARLACEGG